MHQAFALLVALPLLSIQAQGYAAPAARPVELVSPHEPNRPLADRLADDAAAAVERLASSASWQAAWQASRKLLAERAPEVQRSRGAVAAALALVALADAGTGDEDGALCRWRAALSFDPSLVEADLSAYGAAGQLLEEHPLENLENAEQSPRRLVPAKGAVTSQVTPPEIVSTRRPEYTLAARQARVAGTVILEAVINEKGRIVQTRVLKGLPFGLDVQSVDAVCDWTFKPATLLGRPVPVYYVLTVNFQPHDDTPPVQP
jgi:TonB family protein